MDEEVSLPEILLFEAAVTGDGISHRSKVDLPRFTYERVDQPVTAFPEGRNN